MTAISPFTAHTEPLPNIAPMPSIGAILRKARDERGQTLEQCADILKIRRVYLEAIENNNWDDLPDLVYVTGFIRSYANYLGLDGERVITQLKSTHRGMNRKAELDMPKPMYDVSSPNKKIIFGAAAALLLIYIGWSFLSPRPVREAVTPPPADIVAETAPAVPAAAPAIIVPTPAVAIPPATSEQIVIRVIADSWVQIRGDNGQVVLSRVLRTGESYQIPGTGQARLTTGNLAGLQFELDGVALPTVSRAGTVVRDVPLSVDSLNQLIKNTKASAGPAPAASPAVAAPVEDVTD